MLARVVAAVLLLTIAACHEPEPIFEARVNALAEACDSAVEVEVPDWGEVYAFTDAKGAQHNLDLCGPGEVDLVLVVRDVVGEMEYWCSHGAMFFRGTCGQDPQPMACWQPDSTTGVPTEAPEPSFNKVRAWIDFPGPFVHEDVYILRCQPEDELGLIVLHKQ